VVVQASATGSIDSVSCSLLTLAGGVTFVNDGTVAVGVAGGSAGQIDMQEGAQLQNAGTLNAYSHAEGCVPGSNAATILNYGGTAPSITNTGTLNISVGANTMNVNVAFKNEGSVNGQTGTLQLSGGGSGSGPWTMSTGTAVTFAAGAFSLSGNVLSGSITIAGATVSATNVEAHNAKISLTGGTLTIPSGVLTTIPTLGLSGGTLSVGGELDVSSSMFSSGSAVVSGAGRVVVQASATGSIDSVSCSLLTLAGGVTFVNDGTVAVGVAGGSAGQIDMQEGAQLQNAGTLNAYSHAEGCVPGSNAATILNYGGTAPSITNTGTFQSAVGAYTAKIGVEFNNQGKTNGVSGTVEFTGGGVPEQVAFGSWAVQSAANIVLAAGKYLIGEGVDLSAVQITGATIERSK
jgi:hypothetical protein